jgi:hypothetical protein
MSIAQVVREETSVIPISFIMWIVCCFLEPHPGAELIHSEGAYDPLANRKLRVGKIGRNP